MTVFIKVSTNWLVTLVSMFFESSYEMATCLANIAGNFGHIFKLFSILFFRDGRQVLISRRVITGCNGAPGIMNVLPTTASSINSKYKTSHNRSFIALWS